MSETEHKKRATSARRKVRVSSGNRRKQKAPAKNPVKIEIDLPKPELEAKSEPKLKVEPKPEPKPELKVEPKLEAKPEPKAKADSKLEVKPEPNSELKSEAKPEPIQEQKIQKPVRKLTIETPVAQTTKVSTPQPVKILPAQPQPVKVQQTPIKTRQAQPANSQSAAIVRINNRPAAYTSKQHIPAKTLKEEAIKKAVAATNSRITAENRAKKTKRMRSERLGWQRIALAFSCALVLVFAIVYFVNLSAPDVSLKVAAMQTGIDASYPSYTPRDFYLTDITSENGKITLNFKNPSSDTSYSLVEEKSAWDSNSLYNNFVKTNYKDDYSTVREQGLTVYISKNTDAAWVNGGVFYRLTVKSGSLTKKQITTIATSL